MDGCVYCQSVSLLLRGKGVVGGGKRSEGVEWDSAVVCIGAKTNDGYDQESRHLYIKMNERDVPH